jgi:hypothetical protein
MKRTVLSYNQIDTAGKEEQTKKGCRNAIVGIRFDHVGGIWITHIHYGYWSASQECDAMWASCVRNQPEQFEYEVSGAHEKYARSAHQDFQGQKSMELRRPVVMPIVYVNPSEADAQGQNRRIEKCEPYARTGRIKILADAGSDDDVKSFIREFCDFPWADRRDGPDAFSRVLKRMEAFQFEEPPMPDAEIGTGIEMNAETGMLSVDGWVLRKAIADLEGMSPSQDWGDQGRKVDDEAPFEDRDSIPPPVNGRRVA